MGVECINQTCLKFVQDAQLLLGLLTGLVVSDLQGRLRLMIFIISERVYATSY